MVVGTWLARYLMGRRSRHTMRFLFIPGTIGSIAWLALNEAQAERVAGGLVLSCLGDAGQSTYKRSRRGDALIDRAAVHVLSHGPGGFAATDFIPYGYDERQYCSPGFDLPVGCLTRTPNGRYPEYHTSADDPALVRPEALEDSLAKLIRIVEVVERNASYLSLNPRCEPQLGRRGLYRATGGADLPGMEMALLWVLNLSDGRHTLLDIAERSGVAFHVVLTAAEALERVSLLQRLPPESGTSRSPLTSHAELRETPQ
jgi:aminopeptidase-like protein